MDRVKSAKDFFLLKKQLTSDPSGYRALPRLSKKPQYSDFRKFRCSEINYLRVRKKRDLRFFGSLP